jgi:hypothetical protein
LPPSAAEYSFGSDIIFVISLREITKMMSLPKYNLAQSAKNILFTTLSNKILRGEAADTNGNRY